MTDFKALLLPDRGEPARLIHVVDKDNFSVWAKKQSPARQSMLEAIQFDAKSAFQFAILQGGKDGDFDVVTCVDKAGDLAPWCLARLGQSLPAGKYRIDAGEPGLAALGWLLSQHRFDRYKSSPAEPTGPRILLTGDGYGYDPDYKGIMEVLVDAEGLMNGFKVHWPNNSDSSRDSVRAPQFT